MSDRRLRQFFGPSARHDRACVELNFPLGDRTHDLAPLDAVLTDCGFKLREYLPEDPLPLDQAVRRLAGAMLAKHHDWWSDHGAEGARGWAAIATPYPQSSALALVAAFDLLHTGGGELPADLDAKLRRLSNWLASISHIMVRLRAAADLFGLDTAMVHAGAEVFQIGQGTKGLHFRRTTNQRDGATGRDLETSKHVTVETLQRFGLPTTRGVLVQDPRQVARAVKLVGAPCVVKPTNMALGLGVAAGLTDPAEIAAAAAHALELSGRPVLIENHVEGYDHRLVVVGEDMLWAYRKVPGRVTGDGTATVRELIERENRRRAAIRSGSEAYLYQIAIDQPFERFLRGRYGLTVDSVVPADRSIDLAGQANIARGGLLEDVTASVHPDIRELAIRAARLFRIHALGIDYITPDISRSWKEVETAIIEVNRMPGISGVGDASLMTRMFFPNRYSGQVPTIAVVGDEVYRSKMTDNLRAAFGACGLRLLTAPHTESRRKAVLNKVAPRDIETLMLDPEADAVAVLCDPAALEASGLPLRRCDLAIVQDGARLPWLSTAADTILAGGVSKAKIDRAVARLAKTYADPGEGGPMPVLEPVDGGPADTLRLTVWRARAMPRAWFWREVGLEAPQTAGLTDHTDLLGAVKALADASLKGAARPADGFTHGELVAPWFRVTFQAEIALPARHRDEAREALLSAVRRVNQIASAKIERAER